MELSGARHAEVREYGDKPEPYHVTIEETIIGGYLATVRAPGDMIGTTKHADTKEEARKWAQTFAAWHRTREPDEEYEL